MSNPYTPRKKREVKPVIPTKRVRIDHRTEVEVSVSIPDEVAIERYYTHHPTVKRPAVDEVEELEEAIVDDTNLPEID